MPETLFKVDLDKKMDEQDLVGHNRWHPDIPPVVAVEPGTTFRIECLDWTDGQIGDNDTATVNDLAGTALQLLGSDGERCPTATDDKRLGVRMLVQPGPDARLCRRLHDD